MQENASTNPATQNPPAPEPILENPRSSRFPMRTIILIASSVLIMMVIVVGVYLLVNRNRGGSVEGGATSMQEYQNPNGFKFNFSENSSVSETTEGVIVTGESDLSFVVSSADGSLSQTVSSIAENFGGSGESLETYTINQRVGFKMNYEGNAYYYFPLVGDYYLEIVDRKPESSSNKEVLNSLVFTPPQARLN